MINFREQYKRIGGKQLNEDREDDFDGQKAMAKKLRRTKINGYGFEVDRQGNDNWSWYNKKTKKQFYATPWETLAATSPGGSGPQDIVAIEAYDEKGDEDRSIPNKARYKHSGNLRRDLANYLKIVKTVIRKLK
jgi:hypothetical protein